MPLIWTDDNGLVTGVHNQPSLVLDEESREAVYVAQVPAEYDSETEQRLHYDDQDGFYYSN
jgi:hypothetical protein